MLQTSDFIPGNKRRNDESPKTQKKTHAQLQIITVSKCTIVKTKSTACDERMIGMRIPSITVLEGAQDSVCDYSSSISLQYPGEVIH